MVALTLVCLQPPIDGREQGNRRANPWLTIDCNLPNCVKLKVHTKSTTKLVPMLSRRTDHTQSIRCTKIILELKPVCPFYTYCMASCTGLFEKQMTATQSLCCHCSLEAFPKLNFSTVYCLCSHGRQITENPLA